MRGGLRKAVFIGVELLVRMWSWLMTRQLGLLCLAPFYRVLHFALAISIQLPDEETPLFPCSFCETYYFIRILLLEIFNKCRGTELSDATRTKLCIREIRRGSIHWPWMCICEYPKAVGLYGKDSCDLGDDACSW